LLMRKYGQEIIEATAGKKIHGTGAIPGGINRNLPIERRDHFLSSIDEMLEWAQDAVKLAETTRSNTRTWSPSSAHSRRTTCLSCGGRRRA
jgi:coenzyme F420-reducing hydrogenase alpha subunit